MTRDPQRVENAELAGWGNFPRADCRILHAAPGVTSLADVPDFAHFTPRGMGRSYGDASLGTSDSLVLMTDHCQRLIAIDPLLGKITAEAGVTLQAVIDAALPHGWFLPVTPGTRFVTLGGAVAGNVHGKNHHGVGAIERFLDAVTVVTEDGEKICGPREKPDLFRATVGGFGLTGLISKVTLQLLPVETAWIETLMLKVSDFDELLAKLAEHDKDYPYSITWVDTLTKGRNLGRGVVVLGRHARRQDLPPTLVDRPLDHSWKLTRSLPKLLSGWVLSDFSNRCLNRAFYFTRSARPQHSLASIESYFYPLDALSNWNAMYGRRGFVQYQLVLPDERDAVRGMRKVLELLATRKVGSFVAGLKRMRQDENLLPFGMSGYTFGIDFGFHYRQIEEVLKELDRIVIAHGGRVCLSKDSRLSPATFREMYPEFPAWREVVCKYAPSHRFTSRLAQRLRLLEA